MMRENEEMKVCLNSLKEKKNLEKVKSGMDFREQKFNISFCHCVFLIRATMCAGTFPISH